MERCRGWHLGCKPYGREGVTVPNRSTTPTQPVRMTVTGADSKTSIDDLVQFTLHRPWLEVGLLFSEGPAQNRYPHRPWLFECLSALKGRAAFHICGTKARQSFLVGDIDDLAGLAGRVQLNGTLDATTVTLASQRVSILITQHNTAYEPLATLDLQNHWLLVDESGGRGIAPKSWVRPVTTKAVGFAGGLGPMSLAAQLPFINAAAEEDPRWWIDMEGQLRTSDDWCDIHRVRQCTVTFANFLRHNFY